MAFVPLVTTPPVSSSPLPFPWTPPPEDARRCLLSSVSASCHHTINRSPASRIPRYLFPVFLSAVDHNAVSTPNTKGASYVDLRWLGTPEGLRYMHMCQVLICPPDLGFSPPAIVPNITRLGNRSLLCRGTLPGKNSRRLRRVVTHTLSVEDISWMRPNITLGMLDRITTACTV